MSKDPSPKADGLRAMREATRGHLQATAEPKAEKLERARKLIPFAGKPVRGREPKVPEVKQPHKPRKSAKPKKGKS